MPLPAWCRKTVSRTALAALAVVGLLFLSLIFPWRSSSLWFNVNNGERVVIHRTALGLERRQTQESRDLGLAGLYRRYGLRPLPEDRYEFMGVTIYNVYGRSLSCGVGSSRLQGRLFETMVGLDQEARKEKIPPDNPEFKLRIHQAVAEILSDPASAKLRAEPEAR